MSATCEGGFGPTRSSISDTASQYVTADRPETTAAFTASPDINPNFSTASQTPPFHTIICLDQILQEVENVTIDKCMGQFD